MKLAEAIVSVQAWFQAARPRTLALAVAAVALGILLAAARRAVAWDIAVLNLATAILLQILSNLANDYGDTLHGADSATRAGPKRAVQSGRISHQEMRRAIALVAGSAMITGAILVWRAFGAGGLLLVLLFLLLGALAIWAAIAYTASSRPYGYAGLGDVAVFLFFGLVGVAGSYFLQMSRLSPVILLPATSVGLFSVAVLNVNNIRDIDSDREAGKWSLPVRWGEMWARRYHWFLLLTGLAAATGYVALTYRGPWQGLFLLTAPLFFRNGLLVARGRTAEELDPLLKQLSISTFLFALTFGAGQFLAA